MPGLRTRAYSIVELEYGDFFRNFKGWTFRDFRANPDSLHKWLGVTTVMYCPADGMVHCGLERFDNDILWVFDPKTGLPQMLGRPFYHQRRISALALAKDGTIYGTCGDRDSVRVFGYDRAAETFQELGVVYDPIRCQPAEKIHSLTLTEDGVLYGGEIDNLHRTSWLWEMTLQR